MGGGPLRVILFGASGQIGSALCRAQKPARWEVLAPTRDELDITNVAMVRDLIQREKPDLVMNAAGYVDVNRAEDDRDAAMAVNFDAVAHMAVQCSRHDVPLIHLSTDYVFDGRHDAPYQTDDSMNPINVYGASKLLGEEAVRHELSWHVVLRVASVFSVYGQNILTKTVQAIDEQNELKVVTDQLCCPTPAESVADAMILMGEKILGGKVDGFGTFHLCGGPPCTRYQWAQAVMAAYASHTTRRPDIAPVTSAAHAHLAKRPAYAVLDCARIAQVYGIEQPDWQDALRRSIATLVSARGPACAM